MPILINVIAATVLVFVSALLGTIFGALGGWVVGLFFDETLAKLALMIGLEGTPPWQIGAIFGFISGFIRSTSTVTHK